MCHLTQLSRFVRLSYHLDWLILLRIEHRLPEGVILRVVLSIVIGQTIDFIHGRLILIYKGIACLFLLLLLIYFLLHLESLQVLNGTDAVSQWICNHFRVRTLSCLVAGRLQVGI